jgi:hypothetical protein
MPKRIRVGLPLFGQGHAKMDLRAQHFFFPFSLFLSEYLCFEMRLKLPDDLGCESRTSITASRRQPFATRCWIFGGAGEGT